MTDLLLLIIAILLGLILQKIHQLQPLRYKGTMLEDNGFWGKAEPMKYKKTTKSKKGKINGKS